MHYILELAYSQQFEIALADKMRRHSPIQQQRFTEKRQITNVNVGFLATDPESIPMISKWLLDEFGYLEPDKSVLAFEQKLRDRLRTSKDVAVCVSMQDGIVTGTASLIKSDGIPCCSELAPWLADVYVVPAYRRRGSGEALTRFIAAHAKRCGQDKLYLYTERQQAFFEKLGWKSLKPVQHLGATIEIMVLAL